MLRFGLWVGGLSLLLAGLTVGVMLWGHANPGPDELQAAGFDVCDGKPCFMGITPGVTTWDAARNLLANKGAEVQSSEIRMGIGNVEFWIDKDNSSSVNSLVIEDGSYLHDELPSLLYFVYRYGTPCGVGLQNSDEEILIVYPFLTIQIFLDNRRVSMESGTDIVQMAELLYDKPMNLCYQSVGSQDFGVAITPWLGFTSLDKYRAYAAQTQ